MTTIPPEVAANVLWHFGKPGGYQPDAFTQNLLATITSADLENTARLANAFPGHVAAVTAMQYDPDGAAALQRAAGVKLRCVHCGDADGPWSGTPDQPTCEGCVETRGAA